MAGSDPIAITEGPGNTLWFTEQFGDKIGEVIITPLLAPLRRHHKPTLHLVRSVS
jgi:hypothetical protein